METSELDAAPEYIAPTVGPRANPPRPTTRPQPEHRYQVGERLHLIGGGNVLSRAAASCQVIALLPFEGKGALFYRVRSESEQFERVVAEIDLSRTS